jgi:hypothetical protein
MREIRKSGSMSGDGKRSYGRIEAPPNREIWRQQPLPGPIATAPVLDSTAFPSSAELRKLSPDSDVATCPSPRA